MPTDESLKGNAIVQKGEKQIVWSMGPPRSRLPATFQSAVGRTRGEAGIALLLALLVIVSLSGLGLSIVLLTESQIRLGKTVETQAQVYYASLAGLEEARGRLTATAPDTISASLPTKVTDVLYLVNSSTQDPVEPTNPSSPHYDYEYAQEFAGGFSAATVLPSVASDQPGAGTTFAIPYKWVRITLKTEYSSKQDVNQDGVLDSTTPINWYGSSQDLSTAKSGGVPVYKLTALAVDRSRIRKLVQAEVAGATNLNSLATLATAGSASLNGIAVGDMGPEKKGVPNLIVDGTDVCAVSSLPGIMTEQTVTIPGVATIKGSPSATIQKVSPFPLSPSALINSLRPSATPILTADPTHITSGTSYVGTNVVLGSQAAGTVPAQPMAVYADKSLAISGSTGTGEGILLVDGNLSITGGFDYRGLIIVNGSVTLTSNSAGNINIEGALISSGNLSADSSASNATSLNMDYNSCAVAESYQILPKTILTFREPL